MSDDRYEASGGALDSSKAGAGNEIDSRAAGLGRAPHSYMHVGAMQRLHDRVVAKKVKKARPFRLIFLFEVTGSSTIDCRYLSGHVHTLMVRIYLSPGIRSAEEV